jgi:hypothetical protein
MPILLTEMKCPQMWGNNIRFAIMDEKEGDAQVVRNKGGARQ